MRLTPHMWCAALQVNLAKRVAKQPGPPIELNTITDLFLQRNAVREATAFLLDALQDNKPHLDHGGELQDLEQHLEHGGAQR